ncbi:DUF368 domain-containing protein [Lapidilactobacillus bayanensis]|uniref:DUF368 domain-containing protein n=1 Tax=Lapidilactobacillus bayanensis TaxID=2485998 RepID=UPI000F76845D|nr:DUF368 domain-containing protein [Lapidilactobacillus bayanensis]
MIDWLLRFVKGIFIGSGFILPGVSGGALAAVFGVYERIISFLAHMTKNFKKNLLYLIPLGLGGLAGVFIFSFVVSFALGKYEAQILWFFIGAIVGTVPSLWQQAGKEGRNHRHLVILAVTFVISLVFLIFGEQLFGNGVSQNFGTWILAGFLIGLGMIIPGLSPSNFLIYMGMYKDMADGIKTFDLAILIPLAIGGVVSVLLLSKVADYIFRRAYAGMFHFILGVVFASTIMIIPFGTKITPLSLIASILLCIAGIALGYWMSHLEEKHASKTLASNEIK